MEVDKCLRCDCCGDLIAGEFEETPGGNFCLQCWDFAECADCGDPVGLDRMGPGLVCDRCAEADDADWTNPILAGWNHYE